MSSNNETRLYSALGLAHKSHISKENTSFAAFEADYTNTATNVLLDAIADPQLRPEDAVRLEITVLNFQRDTLLMTESRNPKIDQKALGVLNKGLERSADALDATRKMSEYSKFETSIWDTALADFDKEGLPSGDGFRKFARSQRTSIENVNAAASTQLPEYIKNFNQARIDLIEKALVLYKMQQHEHLREFVRWHPDDRKAQMYAQKNPGLSQDTDKAKKLEM
ncbi:MAG: hypothetical protein IJ228_09975 [Succinivibrio sp.]|nr:hypothetical protein [Succinivibrio sp.]